MVQLIKKTVDHVEIEQKKSYKKMFVAHDWGSFLSYLLDVQYPKYMSNLVSLDVGTGIEDTFKGKLYTVSYQWFLAGNFLIGGQIGKISTQLFVDYFAKPYGLTKDDRSRLDSSWNYFYYYFWKRIGHYGELLREYKPSAPIAFIYGNKKPFNFHTEKFIETVKSCKNCEVHAVEEGHWVMDKHHETVLEVITRRAAKVK